MFHKIGAAIAMAAFTSSLAIASQAPAFAESDSNVTKVLTTELEGLPGMEANIVLFEVGPGWSTINHIHPGHVFVYVIEGVVEINVEGRDPSRIEAGDAFHEVPDRPMIATNLSASEGARFVVFQVGEQGKPLMAAAPE